MRAGVADLARAGMAEVGGGYGDRFWVGAEVMWEWGTGLGAECGEIPAASAGMTELFCAVRRILLVRVWRILLVRVWRILLARV